jgi:hypothetical protein
MNRNSGVNRKKNQEYYYLDVPIIKYLCYQYETFTKSNTHYYEIRRIWNTPFHSTSIHVKLITCMRFFLSIKISKILSYRLPCNNF